MDKVKFYGCISQILLGLFLKTLSSCLINKIREYAQENLPYSRKR